MQRRALPLAALLLLPVLLAGCTNEDRTRASPEVIRAVADTVALPWARGSYWAYDATFTSGRTHAIALVVHEAREDGFRLGSNRSSGFFGLPFSGNVSADLNPEIGGVEWPMYRFPLSDGASWSYAMFGHDATTTAYAAMVRLPDGSDEPGFRLEASSYGQVFARYDYSPTTGWFTRLELVDPGKREQVLDVRLTDHGAAWGRAYYVERVIRAVRIAYPNAAPPAEVPVDVPSGYARVRATLTVQAAAGALDATLGTEGGASLAEARVLGKGLASDRADLPPGARTLLLRQVGAGAASLYLEITGIRDASPEPKERSTQRPASGGLLGDSREVRIAKDNSSQASDVWGTPQFPAGAADATRPSPPAKPAAHRPRGGRRPRDDEHRQRARAARSRGDRGGCGGHGAPAVVAWPLLGVRRDVSQREHA